MTSEVLIQSVLISLVNFAVTVLFIVVTRQKIFLR